MSGYPPAIARFVIAAQPLGLHRKGSEWSCRCPAHNDHDPSLDLRVAPDGRLLMTCRVGCSNPDIVAAYGIPWSVLFPDDAEPPALNGSAPPLAPSTSARRPRGEPEAVYDYTDEQSALLFQVVRFPGKDFRQRRPLQGGGWAWNLQHTRRVLYHLDELIARPDELVWLVEGEKDADRLRSYGLLATTAPGGAGPRKWRSEFTEMLRNRRVAQLTDYDDVDPKTGRRPGPDFANDVLAALQGVAAEAFRVELEDLSGGQDVSDWLDAGHTVEELEQLRIAAAASSPPSPTSPVSPSSPMSPAQVRQRLLDGITTFQELMAREFEAIRWATYNLIGEGCTLLVGSPKIGKSWLILSIALAVGAGDVALGRSTRQGGVLYLALEDSPRRLRSRVETLWGTRPVPAACHFTTTWTTVQNGGLVILSQWLKEHPDTRLVIVDTLAAIKGIASGNSDAYTLDYSLVHDLAQVAQQHDVALVVVHHDRKATSEDWLHTVSGTLGLTGAADAILLLRRGRNEADGVLHATGRDVPEQKLALSFNGSAWTLLDGDADTYEMDSKRREILDVLRNAGKPMTARMVAEAVEGNREALKKMLRRMAKDGLVTLTDAGWSLPPQHSDSGDMGTQGSRFPPPPTDEQTAFWTGGGDKNAGPGGVENSYPASPGPQAVNPCPKCGCEGKEAGVSPTTFQPMSKCTACGWRFLTRNPPTEPQTEESA